MTHSEQTLQTRDGVSLYTQSWLPDTQAKAAILLVHGGAEHSGRYGHVAEFLNQRGYAVYSLDHRGHGRSGGIRGDFQYADQPLDDLDPVFEAMTEAQPGKPYFVYGHSMGALIGVAFALRCQRELAGLVVSGIPLTFDTLVPSPLMTLGRIVVRFKPTLPLLPLNLKGVSRDPAVRAAYFGDPLVQAGPMRTRLALTLYDLLKQTRARLSELTLPIYIFHGGADPLVPVSGSELLHKSISAADKTLRIYPGVWHEPHNEPEKAAVLADVANWLDSHLNAHG